MKKQGYVICGFPGTGKRYAVNNLKGICKIVNIDENEFIWASKLLEEFGLKYPKSFINHIKSLQETHDFILLSSDRSVRDILSAYGIEYHLVYPQIGLRNEYIGRAYIDKYTNEYIDWLTENWSVLLKNCIDDGAKHKYALPRNEYIGNYILKLMAEDDHPNAPETTPQPFINE